MNNIILNFEKTTEIDGEEVLVDIGTEIPVLREHIARDIDAHPNRIVRCEVIDIKRDENRVVVFQVRAQGFARTPWIDISKIEVSFSRRMIRDIGELLWSSPRSRVSSGYELYVNQLRQSFRERIETSIDDEISDESESIGTEEDS